MSWEKKKNPWFNHTYCVQGLNITTSQNSITENGNGLNSLYWYKAIVRCTHLVARILQHGCKFSSRLKVNKISNQTVHHQSATKCDSMLQDIKRLQACKAENTFCISDIAQKKNKITNIFKCRHGKNYSLENKMWRQTSGWVTCAKPSRRNTDQVVLTHLVGVFKPKLPEVHKRCCIENSWGKKRQLSNVLSEFVIFLKLGVLWWKLKIFIANFSPVSPNQFWRIFSMLLQSHSTIKWRWKKFRCN